MSTPENLNVFEIESSNPEFNKGLDVFVSLDRVFVNYRFFYRINGTQANVLGSCSGDSLPINDDSERDRIAANWGKDALSRTKKYIQTLHPEIEEIIVQPEELRIGGVYGPEYVAWSKEDTNVNKEND